MTRHTCGLALLLLVFGGVRAAGQQGSPGGVSLDFLAVSPDGLPVADLKAPDVSLKVDGRARPIRSLRFVQVSDGTAANAAIDPSVPPPFGSNAPDTTASRAMVLVVDDDSFRVGTERALREAAARFLAGLTPGDRVALVTMPYGGTKVDLTTDREQLRSSLALVIGQAPARESRPDIALRTRRTLDSLTGLLEGLASGPPPIILFFSAGLLGPTLNTLSVPPGMSGGDTIGSDLQRESFQNVGNAAAVAGAHFYVIQPTAAQGPVEGLEHLAGVTGGTMMHLGGADSNALSRVARETAGYYVAEFDPEPSMRNGSAHRVELRVSRPDVSVRARPSIVIPKSGGRSPSPRDMLRQSGVFRDLRLRVSGFASREPGEKGIRVVVVGEGTDPSTSLNAAAAGLFDEKGRLAAQWTAKPEEISSGLVVAGLVVPPGEYRLRFAATDASGRAGTADCDLSAVLTPAGPLQLSALALGVSRGAFMPRLQFGAEPVALAHVEIYGGKAGLPVSAVFELSRTLNGPALVTIPGALGAIGDHHAASGALPIGALPPGDYVVRAIIGVEGQPAGRVVRTLRKARD